ncbi:acetylornithine deacetylase [Sagittula sp.]|uniref:acetylornithine deacetylase n=1 Tax=Sagittula sp. TaxID=2038081 RepID=UPI003513797E
MRAIDWLEHLVSHATVSSAGNLDLVHGLVDALSAAGAVVETFPDETGDKAALLARFGPDMQSGLMLSAHLDVVPVAGQDWTVPPFELSRRGERLHGRGTTDMKGFVACVMDLIETPEIVQDLAKPLWIALSYDEEVGCVGVRPMLAAIAERGIRPDLVLVGEPTSMNIGLGHKGKTAYRARSRGIARHSAEAPLAVNALHALGDLMAGLRRMQEDLARDGVREDGYSVPYSSVHVGVLSGGTAVNVVPSEATMLFETRFPASEDAAALDARIRTMAQELDDALPDGCRLTVKELLSYPGLTTDAAAPAVQRMTGCLPETARPCWLSFGTEGGLFAERLDVPVVVCGPGDMAQGHQPDEFIETEQLAECRRFLERVAAAFCKESLAATPG